MTKSRKDRAVEAARAPRNVSPEDWERWLAAFREAPGQTSVVAEQMGVGERRARRLWRDGIPKQGLPAIRTVIAREQVEARALRGDPDAADLEAVSGREQRTMLEMLEREKKRARVASDAAQTRAEEGRLVQAARRNALALMLSTSGVLKGAMQLGQRIEEALAAQAAGPLRDFDAKAAVALVRQAAAISRFGTEAAKMAVQMERLLMGQPDGDSDLPDGARLSPEQAERWITVAARAVRMARERGVLDVRGESVGADRQLPG